MSSTDFKSGTPISKDWLNDVDALVYDAFGFSGSVINAKFQLNVGSPTLTTAVGFVAREFNSVSAGTNKGINLLAYFGDTSSSLLSFHKSRGALNTDTAVLTGDGTMAITARGYVGATGGYVQHVNIRSVVDGAVSDALNGLGGTLIVSTRAATGNLTDRLSINASGSVVVGNFTAPAALLTTATDGFLYVPTCAGTPTGVPTAVTGGSPIVVNTTNNKLYFYSGGAWRDAGP